MSNSSDEDDPLAMSVRGEGLEFMHWNYSAVSDLVGAKNVRSAFRKYEKDRDKKLAELRANVAKILNVPPMESFPGENGEPSSDEDNSSADSVDLEAWDHFENRGKVTGEGQGQEPQPPTHCVLKILGPYLHDIRKEVWMCFQEHVLEEDDVTPNEPLATSVVALKQTLHAMTEDFRVELPRLQEKERKR